MSQTLLGVWVRKSPHQKSYEKNKKKIKKNLVEQKKSYIFDIEI